jgi:CO/xanthine dehydrogenase Mo-binding subunit
MIVSAQALLNRSRFPTDEEIRSGLETNLCRCGVYDRVRRAIKHRVGRPDPSTIYSVITPKNKFDIPQGIEGLPPSLIETPELDSWIKINSDETVTLFTGKVEYGQGIRTAFAQIIAEEMDLSLDQIRVVMADTQVTPNEGVTAGSMSMETSGNAIRFVAAEARKFLLSIAYEELEAPMEQLEVSHGVIKDPDTDRSITYWDLLGGKRFGVNISGSAHLKNPAKYQVIGRPVQRLDLVAKVTGEPFFVHDLEMPGMVHARVVRPPIYGARLISVDLDHISQMPGVLKIVRDGSFLAVVAEGENEAIKAFERLEESAAWGEGTHLTDQDTFLNDLTDQDHNSVLVVDGTPVNGPIPPVEALEDINFTISATYSRPYQMHASLGPSTAVAQMLDGELTIWAHSQGIFSLKSSIAHVLGLDVDDVRVIYVEGPGCYGHTGADDVALDAALLARALPGRPISTKWTLQDEKKWEPYGPAMVIKMQASLDNDGYVVDWNHDVYSPPHLGRSLPDAQTSSLLPSWFLSKPMKKQKLAPGMWKESGAHRNANPLYNFPQRRIVKHSLKSSPLRVSSLRSLGAFANIFAIESFIDELAQKAEIDPLEFRLDNLTDKRAIAVLEAAAKKVGWRDKLEQKVDHGRGIAFAQYKNRACYAAVVVELSVDRKNGQIALKRAVIAADAGQIVNPDGLSNQLEGGFIQAASMVLYEEVQFDRDGITSDDWESYPILRFTNAPIIETVLLDRPGYPFLGTGEGTFGPTPAAIANAIFDAVGVRMRRIPFRPDHILRAISAGDAARN